MATLTVTYAAKPDAKFDRAYYDATHIPMLDEAWGDHGYVSAEVLYPVDDSQPFVAMAVLRFKDQASIDASMAAPRTGEVVADMAKFTNLTPDLYRAAD
ncbi:MAG: EthD family reductase [Pseudomonadota bacterium]